MSKTNADSANRADTDAVLDTAPMLVWVTGADGGRTYFNRTWLEFTGRTFEQELGDGWTENVHADDFETCVGEYRRAFEAREPFELEYRLKHVSGEYRWVMDRGSPVFDGEGNFSGFVGSCWDITEHRNARVAAERSETTLQRILDSAMDAIISIDEDHLITVFNRGAERILACPAEEAIGQPLSMFIPPEFREVHTRHVRDFGSSGVSEMQMSPREVSGMRRNGERFPAEARISQARVGGQSVFTVILRDISERKRADNALAFLSEASLLLSRSLDLRETLNSIARLSLNYFADWCVVHLREDDGEIRRTLAVHKDQVKERMVNQLRDEGVSLAPVREVIKSTKPMLFPEIPAELPGVPEDRQKLVRELGIRSAIIAPLMGRGGCLGTISFVAAESGRRYDEQDLAIAAQFGRRAGMAAENALLFEQSERERARFSSIVLSVDYGLCQIDKDGRIEMANPAAATLLQRPAEEMRGRKFHDLVHGEGGPARLCAGSECPLVALLTSSELERCFDTFVTRSATAIPVRVSCSPVMVFGQRMGAVIAFEDISERLAAEQRKDDFLAFATHELRNPLTPILGLSRWLDRHVKQTPERFDSDMAEAVETLLMEADRLAGIVDVFLDLSRIESDRMAFEPGPVDLCDVIATESSALAHRHPEVRLTTQPPAGNCSVITDEVRIRQVLSNLLENAAKYGGETPEVTVSLDEGENEVAIRVADRGPGIPEEDQARIFERFQRGTSSSGKQGLGVGLFLSRQIVEQLGGSITFVSKPGEGTEFIITLPHRMPIANMTD